MPERTKQITRIILFAFMLAAAWPFGNYNARLEFDTLTEIPTSHGPCDAGVGTTRAGRSAEKNYRRAVEIAALLCGEQALDPDEVKIFHPARREQFLDATFAGARLISRGPPGMSSSV